MRILHPILFLICVLGLLSGPVFFSPRAVVAQPVVDFDPSGTFFEPIERVLIEKMTATPPTDTAAVYIPYTRLDLAIQNGLELRRVTQTCRSLTKRNEAYNFTMRLLPDTTITGFTLWDHGQAYPAAIVDRRAAEAAYKETTGDEAPEINRDPGLVRREGNMFSLRIFPVCPGEDKQFTLTSHRRLGMDGGTIEVVLDLESITQVRTDQGDFCQSKSTEISIFLTDRLPVRNLEVPPGFTVLDLGNNRWLLQGDYDCNQKEVKPVLRYQLEIGTEPHVDSFSYSDDRGNQALLRLITRWDRQDTAEVSTPSGRAVYLGCWKREAIGAAMVGSMNAESLRLETSAFLALLEHDPGDHVGFSYWSASGSGESILSRGVVHAPSLKDTAMVQPPFVDTYKGGAPVHLADMLATRTFSQVLLFLDTLPEDVTAQLLDTIRVYSNVPFILVWTGAPSEKFSGLENAHLFSLEQGWLKTTLTADPMQELDIHEQSGLGDFLPFQRNELKRLRELAQRLPGLRPERSGWLSQGEAVLKNLEGYFPWDNQHFRRTPPEAGEAVCCWLSGWFEGSGETSLTFRLEGMIPLLTIGNNLGGIPRLNLKQQFVLKTTDSPRFIGAILARGEVRRMILRIRELETGSTGWTRRMRSTREVSLEEQQEITELRAKIVDLSKKYSFLTNETAFIALPDELLQKYGFTKNDVTASQLYNLDGMKKGGLPEPEEWAMLLLMLALAGLFLRRRKAVNQGLGVRG